MSPTATRPAFTRTRSWPSQLEIWLDKLIKQAQTCSRHSAEPKSVSIVAASQSEDDPDTVVITVISTAVNVSGSSTSLQAGSGALRSEGIFDWEEGTGRKCSLIDIVPANADLTGIQDAQINPFCYLAKALNEGEKDSGVIPYGSSGKVSWRFVSGGQGDTGEIHLTVKSNQ